MKVQTVSELLKAHCAATGRWGILLHHVWAEGQLAFQTGSYLGDLQLAAPDLFANAQAVVDEYGFFFGTEGQVLAIYDRTVGDDGPTPMNPYDGPVRVYALTCDPTGTLLNENT